MEDNTGFLTILMNFVAPLILGLVILYLVLQTRGIGWRQRQHTEKATEDLYERVDRDRERRQEAERREARGER
ncbi:hypothetical protein [Hyphomicrobium sp. CS1GBMeth3]|uniref:hypothetical protein n=1 Tax=Hyphomicrobium sp. CS1GBMeth3 TaxID=1892845 RepID=UPI00093130AD|nr:hypothetical protein [Hyphomicrobium sp. CS1GBMeth3]